MVIASKYPFSISVSLQPLLFLEIIALNLRLCISFSVDFECKYRELGNKLLLAILWLVRFRLALTDGNIFFLFWDRKKLTFQSYLSAFFFSISFRPIWRNWWRWIWLIYIQSSGDNNLMVYTKQSRKSALRLSVISSEQLKFIYSKKATEFCKISTLDLTVTT